MRYIWPGLNTVMFVFMSMTSTPLTNNPIFSDANNKIWLDDCPCSKELLLFPAVVIYTCTARVQLGKVSCVYASPFLSEMSDNLRC